MSIITFYSQEIIDEGEDGFRVVPDTQFYVTRTAFKDNSSHYDYNGKKCQFKEVAKLLRAKGIDLDHNRFLILQGEVEQIALMKPIAQGENDTGMLEFLEDIIGSSRFKEPIDTLKQRTNDMDELRAEKLNRVKLVEKEKDELEKPKNEALQYLNQENEISHKKNLIYQHYIMTFEGKIEETKKKKAEFEASCQELLEKLGKITAKKEKREGQFKEIAKTLEQMTKDVENNKEAWKQHENTYAKITEEMKSLNVKRKKTKVLLEKEKENFEKYEKVPEVNKAKIEECRGLMEKLEAQVEEEQEKYEKALESLKSETQQFQEEKEKYETKLISLRKDETEKESQYNVAKSELDILLSTEQKEQCKLEQFEQKYNKAVESLGDKKSTLKEHMKAIPELQKKIPALEQDFKKYSDMYEELRKKVTSMRSEYEEVRTKQTASKSHGKVIDSLMRQKKSGALPGIYGRLGDLGAIDKKYDVAVSTAAGGSLDRMIVDNVDTAKRCIEFLKKNDVGKGNFLAHDKSRRWAERVANIPKTPENAPRLIDLIKVEDEEMKTAFYQYVQETLVANDLAQAKRIAFGDKRYRVVTLDGDLVEVSGAMSGGGREKMSGLMGTQVATKKDEVNLEAMEKKVHDEQVKLQKVEAKVQESEAALNQAKREKQAREKEAALLQKEVDAFDKIEGSMKNQIKEQQQIVKESKADPKKIKELEKKSEDLKEIFEAASEAARDTKENVNKLNKKIKEIQQSKVKSVQAKLNQVQDQLNKVKKEITRLEVEIKSSERDLNKAKDKCESYEAEVTEAENKMREMKSQKDSLEEQGKEFIESMKKLETERDELEDKLKACKESLQNLEQEETKYKSERIEIDQANEKFASAIKENTKTIQHWKREISKLKLEDIPGEEKDNLKEFNHEELQEVDVDQCKMELNLLEESLASKRPDLKAIGKK